MGRESLSRWCKVGATVIFARTLATGYTSFWRDTVPFCDSFVHDLNLVHRRIYCSEIKSSLEKTRRGFINEFGFRLFREALKKNSALWEFARDKKQVNAIRKECEVYVNRFTGTDPSKQRLDKANLELLEAMELARNTQHFVSHYCANKELLFNPAFSGCGILSECEGDLIIGNTLFEVKAGDRLFRGIDIRQLLLYSALNWNAKQHEFDHIGLLNPRNGVYFTMKIDNLCIRTASMSKDEVFSRIVAYIAGGGISR